MCNQPFRDLNKKWSYYANTSLWYANKYKQSKTQNSQIISAATGSQIISYNHLKNKQTKTVLSMIVIIYN